MKTRARKQQAIPLPSRMTPDISSSLAEKSDRTVLRIASKLIAGLFASYRSLVVTKIELEAVHFITSGLGPKPVAKVYGIVTFEGEFSGCFETVLAQSQDGQWQIAHLYTIVPPANMRDII